MSANFSPTSNESSLVNQIFAQADKQGLNILTGDVAVQIFGGARIPAPVLGEIWNIADEDNNGWLSRKGVGIALRLIGHAQAGEKVSAALVNRPGPSPTIDGYSVVQQHNTGMSLSKSPPPGFPPLSPQDKVKFQAIFNRSGPVNGLLNGETARDIFLKSKLPNEQLMKIWNLGDTRDRGSLDIVDFTIAMYFIHGLMSNKISFVPTALPPGLYEQAGGNPSNLPPAVAAQLTGTSGSFSPVSAHFSRIQPQYTGPNQALVPEHTGLPPQPRLPTLPARPGVVAPFRPVSMAPNMHWDVTASEKAETDSFFDGLDTKRVGYIEGEVAVPFMLNSKLPGEELAQIWDLADVNSDGRLTRDGFAIAMHLIKKKLAGQPLPTSLPESLIPPALRNRTQSSLRNISSSFQQAPEPKNLLDFDDDTPPASAVSPQHTGALNVLQPQNTGPLNVLQPQNTGKTVVPQRRAPPPPDPFGSSSPFDLSPQNDLMGDHDSAHQNQTSSPPLQDRSVEIGNLKNQLHSTNNSLETAKAERARIESALLNQTAELTSLQTQLSLAKAAYDTETQSLTQFKERYQSQLNEIQKSREELIRAESDLSAIRVERVDIEQAFLRDKEEARDLHKRMIEAGQQADQLKGETEKARKEAKQQKGRLAIARKQLSTKETEKAKAEKELEDATTEVHAIIKEAEEVETQLNVLSNQKAVERATSPDSVAFAAAHSLPVSPDPAASIKSNDPPTSTKSNNPFERLAKSPISSTPESQPPFLPFSNTSPTGLLESTNGQANTTEAKSFDDFFGVTDAAAPAPKEEPHPTQTNGVTGDDVLSPVTATDSEQFLTPPTTAEVKIERPESPETPTSNAQAKFPEVDDAGTNFPVDLVDHSATAEVNKDTDDGRAATDLKTKLQELEVEESDSENDDDDDSPLAEVAQKVKDKTNNSATLSRPETPNQTSDLTPNDAPVAKVSPPSAKTSFEDIFGASSNDAPIIAPSTSPLDAFNPSPSPFDAPSNPVEPEVPVKNNSPAGVNDFDETFGGLSAPNTAAPTQFSFAFEDSFDFGANGASQSAVLPAATAPAPSTAAPSKPDTQSNFDDIFATSSLSQSPQSIPAFVSSAVANGTTTVAQPPKKEEDIFANFGTSQNLELSLSPSALAATTSEIHSFPTSNPTSPKAVSTSSPRSSVNRASSPPPRHASPPPGRITSPKPRSSKESHEKVKEAPTRTSKLSIRLPFGKKKNKHHEPMPPPPSNLSPPREELERRPSPGSQDDVEAVKQIVAMGFSRSEAVDALEKYGYDLQRAINSLLQ